MYFINLFKEIRIWFIFYKAVQENKKFLEESGLRIDWIGRIYTIINLPEDIANNDLARDPYAFGELKQFDNVLIKVRLNDMVYPELLKLPDADAFLLVLAPERDYLDLATLLWNCFLYTIGYFILKVLVDCGINMYVYFDKSPNAIINLLKFFF